jgi:hypothetical protein
MPQAFSAFAQGCQARSCLAGALLLFAAPALWAATSNQQNPVVTFTAPGVKQVTLQACNSGGCSTVTKSVTVLDPTPVVTGAGFSPALPEAGQLVRLTATGIGQPPLSFNWQVPGGTQPPSGSSVWWDTAGMAPGAYVVTLQLQNSAGIALPVALPVVLAPATALDFYTTSPCRIYDSRQDAAGPLPSGAARIIQTMGLCGISSRARALAVNVTVIGATSSGNMTVYPGNYPQPLASTINFAASVTRSNHAILALATDGSGTLAAVASLAGGVGDAHLVIDVSGYYAP